MSETDIIRIYTDKELTKEIKDKTFDFGIVSAGEVKEFEFWVLNNSVAHFTMLDFTVNHHEVKVIKAPTELNPDESEKLILEWSPSVTLKQGLKAPLRIQGFELWG